MHEVCKFDNNPLCLDELIRDDLVIHTPSLEHIDHNCKDACIDNEPLFLEELFKNQCDHNREKTCAKDLKSRVPIEKRKLNLSIFTFDKQINDQTSENKIQKHLIDQNFENL